MNGPLLIIGSSGAIGIRLAAGRAANGVPLRLLDQRPPTHLPPAGAEFIQADLRDASAVEKAVEGAVAVIHLAGITEEAPFAEMVEHNITATRLLPEASAPRSGHIGHRCEGPHAPGPGPGTPGYSG